MFTTGSKWQRFTMLAAFAVVAVAAACSGSGNPSAIYPAAPSGNTIAGASSYQLPTVSGMNSTLSVTGTGTLSAKASASAPSVGAIPLAMKRSQSSSANSALIYYTITATSTLTINLLSIQIGFAAPPTTAVYLAYWNGTEWVAGTSPGTYSAGTISLTAPKGSLPITLTAGQSLYLVAYQGQQIGTPPPPSPIASAPSTTLSEGQTETITVTSGVNATISATSSQPTVATISPSSASTGTGTTASFTVAAQLTTGTSTMTFTDQIGQKTTLTITVNDTAPTPLPSPGSAVIGLGDVASIGLSAKPSTQVTVAVSPAADASVAEVNTTNSTSGGSGSITLTTDSTGSATFYVIGKASGTAGITLTDIYGNQGTMSVTISAIANGTFESYTGSGATAIPNNWTPCSIPHTALSTTVNPPYPLTAEAIAAQTSSTSALTSGIPTVYATAPPPNDNPSWTYSAGAFTASTNGSFTITQPGSSGAQYDITSPTTSTPAGLGAMAAFIGSGDAANVEIQNGAVGMCQTITVSSAAPYLSLYVFEGGNGYEFLYDDYEVDIVTGSGASESVSPLLAEENCYLHPGQYGIEASGISTSQGCWPSAYGGDHYGDYNWVQAGFWSPRGPYLIPAGDQGTPVTLFIGIWNSGSETSAKDSEFMYVTNVQTTDNSTVVPSVAPYAKGRSLGTITLKQRASAIQSTKPKP